MREQSNPKFFSAPSLLELSLRLVVKMFNGNPDGYFKQIMSLPGTLKEQLITECHSVVIRTLLNNAKLLEEYKSQLSEVQPYIHFITLISKCKTPLPDALFKELTSSYSHGLFIDILSRHEEFREEYKNYIPENIMKTLNLIEFVKSDKYFESGNMSLMSVSSNNHGIYQSTPNPALFVVMQRQPAATRRREQGPYVMIDCATFKFDVPTLSLSIRLKSAEFDLSCFLETQTLEKINSIISNPIETEKHEENASSLVHSYGGRR